ncbi:MAG: hypothetical protein DWH91_17090 [Planctomycetota bacterium]|nr:MAG: hypothetical protein DWH91_17090 [Planctomycetota bacterium]
MAGVILFLTCSGASSSWAVEESLEQIVTQYKQSFEAIQSIDCRYEIEYPLPPELEPGRSYPRLTTSHWAVEGRKSGIEHFSAIFPSGNQFPGSVESYDGAHVWNLDHRKRRLFFQDDPAEYADNLKSCFTPGQILGHYFTAGRLQLPHLNLVTLLSTDRARLVGPDQVGEHACWRIDFPYPGIAAQNDLPMTVWLDPQHGHLPRRLKDFSYRQTEVLKFQRVEAEGAWFPWEIQFKVNQELQILRVQSVAINKPIASTVFRPALPQGYELIDLDNEAAMRAVRKRDAAQRDAARKTVRAQKGSLSVKTMAPGTISVVDARPRFPSPIMIGLTLGGLGLFFMSAYSLWKLRQS